MNATTTETRETVSSTPTRRFGAPAGLTAQETALYAQIPSEVDYIPNGSFESAATEDKLFGPGAMKVRRPSWTGFEAPDDEAHPRHRQTLKQEEEVHLFLQFNYARYRLAKLAVAQRRRASLVRAREMLLWHGRACQARDILIECNLALVMSMARKSYFAAVDLGDLVSEGNVALLRSVEKFDISRGYRFSTYACGSILKAYGRLAQKAGRYRHVFPTEYDPELEQGDADGLRHEEEWSDSVDELMDVFKRNRAGLSRLERTVIAERFALNSRDRVRTLAEVGKQIGLTNERVRQIQNHALLKLRQVLEG